MASSSSTVNPRSPKPNESISSHKTMFGLILFLLKVPYFAIKSFFFILFANELITIPTLTYNLLVLGPLSPHFTNYQFTLSTPVSEQYKFLLILYPKHVINY